MDLNIMMREQARAGFERDLETAVTNGDTAAAKKATEALTQLALASAPPSAPYGQAEIRAELDKQPWFGTDPEKTTFVLESGKNLSMKKFATAADFAKALVDAVDKKFATAAPGKAATEEDETGDDEVEDDNEPTPEPARKPKKTDGPGEGDANQRAAARRTSGPWKALTDAPSAIQKEINRTADKFAPKTKDGRDKFVSKALEAHYAEHVRKTARK